MLTYASWRVHPHLGTCQENVVRDMLDAGEHDAQGHSRKDVGIVALARLKPLPVQLECGEWRPRGEHTASLAPSVSLFK